MLAKALRQAADLVAMWGSALDLTLTSSGPGTVCPH